MGTGTVHKKASVPTAIESGLIPQGWSIEKDDVVSDFNISEVDWNFQICPPTLNWVGEIFLNERLKVINSIGSLGFASVILTAQNSGVFIIPWEATGHEILFPNTILVDPEGRRHMLQLQCSARWWEMELKTIGNDFYSSHTLPILKS